MASDFFALRDSAPYFSKTSEDAEALRLLEPLLGSPYRFAYANVARKRRFQTAGVVRLLCKAAREECAREPIFAVGLAETAAVIAEALPDGDRAASANNELRGTAWKEASTALRLLGRLGASFDALQRAERAYRRLSDCDIQLGTVELCRAALHWERQQYELALGQARSAAARFHACGEFRKLLEAKEWEAVALRSRGDVVAARDACASTFQLADAVGDAEMKARAANDLGISHRDAGDVAGAGHYFSIALQVFSALGDDAAVAQTRWSIARLALLAGNAGDAAKRFPVIIQQFLDLGMGNDAAQARLDLAESCLVIGDHEEVGRLCAELIAVYRRAEMLTGAVTAASFLEEAARRGTITRRHFAHVRQYLQALERSSQLEFVAPAEVMISSAASLHDQRDCENEARGVGRSRPCRSAAI
jgi:tetratricopeptide (TPR) repeat protein